MVRLLAQRDRKGRKAELSLKTSTWHETRYPVPCMDPPLFPPKTRKAHLCSGSGCPDLGWHWKQWEARVDPDLSIHGRLGGGRRERGIGVSTWHAVLLAPGRTVPRSKGTKATSIASGVGQAVSWTHFAPTSCLSPKGHLLQWSLPLFLSLLILTIAGSPGQISVSGHK